MKFTGSEFADGQGQNQHGSASLGLFMDPSGSSQLEFLFKLFNISLEFFGRQPDLINGEKRLDVVEVIATRLFVG